MHRPAFSTSHAELPVLYDCMSDFDVWQRPLAGLQIGWSTGQVHALMTASWSS